MDSIHVDCYNYSLCTNLYLTIHQNISFRIITRQLCHIYVCFVGLFFFLVAMSFLFSQHCEFTCLVLISKFSDSFAVFIINMKSYFSNCKLTVLIAPVTVENVTHPIVFQTLTCMYLWRNT